MAKTNMKRRVLHGQTKQMTESSAKRQKTVSHTEWALVFQDFACYYRTKKLTPFQKLKMPMQIASEFLPHSNAGPDGSTFDRTQFQHEWYVVFPFQDRDVLIRQRNSIEPRPIRNQEGKLLKKSSWKLPPVLLNENTYFHFKEAYGPLKSKYEEVAAFTNRMILVPSGAKKHKMMVTWDQGISPYYRECIKFCFWYWLMNLDDLKTPEEAYKAALKEIEPLYKGRNHATKHAENVLLVQFKHRSTRKKLIIFLADAENKLASVNLKPRTFVSQLHEHHEEEENKVEREKSPVGKSLMVVGKGRLQYLYFSSDQDEATFADLVEEFICARDIEPPNVSDDEVGDRLKYLREWMKKPVADELRKGCTLLEKLLQKEILDDVTLLGKLIGKMKTKGEHEKVLAESTPKPRKLDLLVSGDEKLRISQVAILKARHELTLIKIDEVLKAPNPLKAALEGDDEDIAAWYRHNFVVKKRNFNGLISLQRKAKLYYQLQNLKKKHGFRCVGYFIPTSRRMSMLEQRQEYIDKEDGLPPNGSEGATPADFQGVKNVGWKKKDNDGSEHFLQWNCQKQPRELSQSETDALRQDLLPYFPDGKEAELVGTTTAKRLTLESKIVTRRDCMPTINAVSHHPIDFCWIAPRSHCWKPSKTTEAREENNVPTSVHTQGDPRSVYAANISIMNHLMLSEKQLRDSPYPNTPPGPVKDRPLDDDLDNGKATAAVRYVIETLTHAVLTPATRTKDGLTDFLHVPDTLNGHMASIRDAYDLVQRNYELKSKKDRNEKKRLAEEAAFLRPCLLPLHGAGNRRYSAPGKMYLSTQLMHYTILVKGLVLYMTTCWGMVLDAKRKALDKYTVTEMDCFRNAWRCMLSYDPEEMGGTQDDYEHHSTTLVGETDLSDFYYNMIAGWELLSAEQIPMHESKNSPASNKKTALRTMRSSRQSKGDSESSSSKPSSKSSSKSSLQCSSNVSSKTTTTPITGGSNNTTGKAQSADSQSTGQDTNVFVPIIPNIALPSPRKPEDSRVQSVDSAITIDEAIGNFKKTLPKNYRNIFESMVDKVEMVLMMKIAQSREKDPAESSQRDLRDDLENEASLNPRKTGDHCIGETNPDSGEHRQQEVATNSNTPHDAMVDTSSNDGKSKDENMDVTQAATCLTDCQTLEPAVAGIRA